MSCEECEEDRSGPPRRIQGIYFSSLEHTINICWRGLCLVVPIVIDGISHDRKRQVAREMWEEIVSDAWSIWNRPSR